MNKPDVRTQNYHTLLWRVGIQRGLFFGILIIAALLAFEVFNFSTTQYALSDLLGALQFAGVSWATILSIAFCGIDFAGIARLFTPEEGGDEPAEVWYLFGAWMLAATMNALLTWWGVSLAILDHKTLGNVVISQQTLLRVVPVFVAVLVWLIRVLIIGTFSVAGERLFSMASAQPTVAGRRYNNETSMPPLHRPVPHRLNTTGAQSIAAAPRRAAARPEPVYRSLASSGRTNSADRQSRQ